MKNVGVRELNFSWQYMDRTIWFWVSDKTSKTRGFPATFWNIGLQI